jgi:hypothetical protein
MMNSDLDDVAEGPSDGAILLRRAVICIVGGILLIFIAGMIAGYTSVVIEHGAPRPIDAAMIGAMLLAGALVVYSMWRLWPRGLDEPVAPRVRSARRILIAALIVSLMLGVLLGEADSNAGIFLSNAPVSHGLATLAIALWMILGPILTWLWWQKIDEHEADAYRDGAFIAGHAYMFIAPAWWMASRTGWLPAQDPMLVVLAVSVLWMVVWFVRRYL